MYLSLVPSPSKALTDSPSQEAVGMPYSLDAEANEPVQISTNEGDMAMGKMLHKRALGYITLSCYC